MEFTDVAEDYRKRIYDRYLSVFKTEQLTFDEAKARRWGRAYSFYLRGWLPQDKGCSIADLACGSGNLLYTLKQMGYHNLAGVDLSPEQVKVAHERFPDVEQGDVLAYLDRHPASFDVLTALDLIEHLTKDEVLGFLDRCFAALKPGGRLILQTPNASALWPDVIRYGDFTHEVCFQDKVLSHLLKLSHFEDVDAREMGPVPLGYSLSSSVRYALWQGIRAGVRAIRMIETGSPGSDVITSVFLISATKPK